MSTGTYAPDPDLHVTDLNNAPVNGGLVWTYIAGTSTPVATYTDVGLTVQNANPIVAGPDGRFAAFLAPGNSYKFVYEFAPVPPATHGAVIVTRDNITGTPISSPSTDVIGTAGETLAAGTAVYLSTGAGGKVAGQWYLADADFDYASSIASLVGVTVNTIAAAAQGIIRLSGQIAIPGATLTPGALYYVSATAGAVTATAPSNTRLVGQALDVATLAIGMASAAAGTVRTETLTGNISALAIPAGAGNLIVYMANASLATIQGIAAGVIGQRLTILSIGAGQVNLSNLDAAAATGTKLLNYVQIGVTPLAAGVGAAELVYDTSSRWRLVAHDQGGWIAFTPVLGGSGGTSGQTYAAQSGAYLLRGRTVTVTGYISLSAKGTITGIAQIQGLPYASGPAPSYNAATLGQMNALATAWVSLSAFVGAGGNAMSLVGRTVASTNVTSMAGTDISNTTDCMFSATYPVQ